MKISLFKCQAGKAVSAQPILSGTHPSFRVLLQPLPSLSSTDPAKALGDAGAAEALDLALD